MSMQAKTSQKRPCKCSPCHVQFAVLTVRLLRALALRVGGAGVSGFLAGVANAAG